MKVTRAASIPLVTHDPYFSIWSGADHLYDKDPVHWSQIRQQLRGYVNVDGVVYSFLGDKEFHETIGQTGVDVTATSTTYTFENEKIILNVKFISPLVLDDLTAGFQTLYLYRLHSRKERELRRKGGLCRILRSGKSEAGEADRLQRKTSGKRRRARI